MEPSLCGLDAMADAAPFPDKYGAGSSARLSSRPPVLRRRTCIADTIQEAIGQWLETSPSTVLEPIRNRPHQQPPPEARRWSYAENLGPSGSERWRTERKQVGNFLRQFVAANGGLSLSFCQDLRDGKPRFLRSMCALFSPQVQFRVCVVNPLESQAVGASHQ
jgi:hypothetical protein